MPIISVFIPSVIGSMHICKDLHGVLPRVLGLQNFIYCGCLMMSPPLWRFSFDFFSGNSLLKLLNNASPLRGRCPVTNYFGTHVLWIIKSSLNFWRSGDSGLRPQIPAETTENSSVLLGHPSSIDCLQGGPMNIGRLCSCEKFYLAIPDRTC